jgi:hypothetical protein
LLLTAKSNCAFEKLKETGAMIATQYNQAELAEILERLPEEKIIEVIDFGRYLLARYARQSNSQLDESALLLQQRALTRIWEDPEEDVYEL